MTIHACTDLLDWFNTAQREMPWRTHPDPYWVWISEAMLQQTQVATVIPYFNRFITQFPTIEALAQSDLQAVLKAWEGLGYYSRARHLHRAAQRMLLDFDGAVPDDYDTLQTLPGFGPYIAAAVVSIAYEKPVPVVDGNVLRVFTRYWGIPDDIGSSKTRVALFNRLVPMIELCQPSQFNQAIMELGALLCSPKTPSCTQCPLRQTCHAFNTHTISDFPVKTKKAPVPHYVIGVGVIWHNGELLVTQRHPDQMLGGLWEFPGGKQRDSEPIIETIRREISEELEINVDVGPPIAVVKHAYSHFKITLIAHHCRYTSGDIVLHGAAAYRWIAPSELRTLPFPTANIKIINAIEKEGT